MLLDDGLWRKIYIGVHVCCVLISYLTSWIIVFTQTWTHNKIIKKFTCVQINTPFIKKNLLINIYKSNRSSLQINLNKSQILCIFLSIQQILICIWNIPKRNKNFLIIPLVYLNKSSKIYLILYSII